MAKVWIPPAALPGLVLPHVSIFDASPNPVIVPIRQGMGPIMKNRVLMVPVDQRTKRRLSRARLLRMMYLFIGFPALLIIIGLNTWNSWNLRPNLEEPQQFPWLTMVYPTALILIILLPIIALLLDRPSVEYRNGGVIVKQVHPEAAWHWAASNPRGAVNILNW